MSDDMTPQRARALLEAATPGTWEAYLHEPRGPHRALWHVGHDEAVVAEVFAAPATAESDAALLAAAPDLARAYLAACEERDRMRTAAEEALEEAARLVEAMADREARRFMSLSLGEARLREAAAAIRRLAEERDDG